MTLEGELLLARSRLLGEAGRCEEAVSAAYQAFECAAPQSPTQVEASLQLSRLAERTGRPVEAIAFAVSARATAAEEGYGRQESEATALLARLVRRYGLDPVEELSADLQREGLDLYAYLDPDEAAGWAAELPADAGTEEV